MRFLPPFIAAFVFLGVCASISAEERSSEVRLAYYGSSDLPDHLAYRDYIGFVESQLNQGASRAEDFVIFSLRLPETEEGRAIARSAVKVFMQSVKGIRQDGLVSQLVNSCAGAEATNWSKDDYYRAMDLQDDINDAIAKQHYLAALQQLDGNTITLLHAELQRHKSRMSLERYDHKVVWETHFPDEDLAERFAENCTKLTYQQQTENGAVE